MFTQGMWVANSESFKAGLPTNPGIVTRATPTGEVWGTYSLDIFWTDSKYYGTNIIVNHDGLILDGDFKPDWNGAYMVPVNVSVVRHKA